LTAPANHGLILQTALLACTTRGHTVHYEIDYDTFEAAITPQTRLFILCQPHNPIGVEYSPEQLARLAEICVRHNLLIISDEIHCDLMLGGARHTPLAMVLQSLMPELAERCITLMAPSKTFNVPGLGCSFAIVPSAERRKQMAKASEGIVPHWNALGIVAAEAAYRYGGDWLAALLQYLTANRDFLVDYTNEQLPGISTTVPQATYLAWLDCRSAGIAGNPYQFFLKQAGVALSDGIPFGPGGEGFVRLNFGCPRAQLADALERMSLALKEKAAGIA
jgi:cystathionine beta-lyase